MSGIAIRFVLGLLRKIKASADPTASTTGFDYIQSWSRPGGRAAQLKLAASIQQNLMEARDAVDRGGLSEEAKVGLFATIDGLSKAFSLSELQEPLQYHVRDIDTALTIFAVVASAIDYEPSDEFVEARESLADDLVEFSNKLEKFELDERLVDAARRQVSILIALLNNADAVGVEAALASYYEMLLVLRNRAVPSDAASAETPKEFWEEIKSWSDRLDSLSRLHDVGQKLLPYVDKIPLIPGF